MDQIKYGASEDIVEKKNTEFQGYIDAGAHTHGDSGIVHTDDSKHGSRDWDTRHGLQESQ
jgi:hypothetical protein